MPHELLICILVDFLFVYKRNETYYFRVPKLFLLCLPSGAILHENVLVVHDVGAFLKFYYL